QKKPIGQSDFDLFTKEHAQPAYDDEQRIIRTGQPLIGKIEKETLAIGGVKWVTTTKQLSPTWLNSACKIRETTSRKHLTIAHNVTRERCHVGHSNYICFCNGIS
ncbi:MAG: hypothetical protein ABF329_11700, partial [Lentimonas sp.]